MKGRRIIYTAEQMLWLEAKRTLPIADYHAAFVAMFGRADVTAANLHALRKRKGWRTGRTGQFVPGQTSWNKGKPHPPRGRSAETQFRKGCRSGIAAAKYKPIGSERMSKDGYLQRKVHDGLPMQSRWRHVHVLNWEAVNGPIPKGHALKCLDGDRTNVAAENWQPIPRGMLPLLSNGRRKSRPAYDDAPDELKPTLMAMARLEHRTTQLKRAATE